MVAHLFREDIPDFIERAQGRLLEFRLSGVKKHTVQHGQDQAAALHGNRHIAGGQFSPELLLQGILGARKIFPRGQQAVQFLVQPADFVVQGLDGRGLLLIDLLQILVRGTSCQKQACREYAYES